MPAILLSFPNILNVSVQIGDIVYYCPINSHINFNFGNLNNVIELGVITAIDGNDIIVQTTSTPAPPAPDMTDFIMFAKNKVVNTSSLVGYYAEVQFVNNSTEKAELFSVGSDVFESSK